MASPSPPPSGAAPPPSAPPSPARSAARAARRAELLTAAVAIIRRQGPDVSMEAIAREAGVTKPILYRHFGSREGLMRALAEDFAGRLVAELEAMVDLRQLPEPLRPRAVLRATIDAYIAFIEADPSLYSFLALRAPQAARSTGIGDRVPRTLARTLRDGLRRTGYDETVAQPWAYGIAGLVHLAGNWWVHQSELPRERLVDALADLLWGGLQTALGPLEENP